MQFDVKGSIILLFATDKKWDLHEVKLKAVTAQGIFFDAACPALVIDRTAKRPLRVSDVEDVLKAAGRDTSDETLEATYGWSPAKCNDVAFLLDIVRQETLALCGSGSTSFEKRFVNLYFEYLIKQAETFAGWAKEARDNSTWRARAEALCNSLTPIPQVWFYCHDPLEPAKFIPENAFRVDFAFWSGERFYAVEIDGNEPEGYAADVRRDRLLRRAGIDLIHVLNEEIMKHGVKIIRALLPEEIIPGPPNESAYVPWSIPF